jgi:hypothetical protein
MAFIPEHIPEQRELLPSDDDVAFFREHGWYISKPIFTEEQIDDALYGAERHWAGERDHPLLIRGFLDWQPGDGDGLRLNDYTSLQNDDLRRFLFESVVGEIAARLTGTPRVRLFHDQLIYKPPVDQGKEAVIGWHTDKAYWQTCTSSDMLTAWIPFHDCGALEGTIHMIDGSHRWPGNEGMRTFYDQDLADLERRFETGGQPVRRVPMELKKGQVSFHHGSTIHGSPPNRSGAPRRSLAVHMQDDANRYRRQLGPDGNPILHINDLLCRKGPDGQPDYTDPDICPVLSGPDKETA